MSTQAFETLLATAQDAHARVPALRDFCGFPTDLKSTPITPRWIPPADLMKADKDLMTPDADPLAGAFLGAADDAFWRLTYEDTDIGADFMDRFGCYCLIGKGGPWESAQMAGFVVYMPPNLWYPWHHHPAEELYYVLAGEAEFRREAEPTEILRPGDKSFHKSNQPHATQTRDKGFLAYVLWRNEFQTPPVLTERAIEGHET